MILSFLVAGAPDRVWGQVVTTGAIPCTLPPVGPAPALVSAAPASIAAGVRQQRLTLLGHNFRRGAKVIFTVPNTDPPQFAPDVTVSTTVVNSGLIIAIIDVNRLSSGTRTMDVVNSDCTNTNPNLGLGIPSQLHPSSCSSADPIRWQGRCKWTTSSSPILAMAQS